MTYVALRAAPSRMLLAALLGASLACVVARTTKSTIEVRGDRTIEQKLRWVEEHITETRLTRLKAQLMEQIPSITNEQLADMSLGWNETTLQSLTGNGSSKGIIVWVTIQHSKEFDPSTMMTVATAILDTEINGPEVAPSPKVAP